MNDVTTILANLRRPKLLIRAARFGVNDYNRNRDLKRIIGTSTAPGAQRAVSSLIEEEARIEEVRKAGDAAYSVSRHVEVLIALIAEARLLPRAGQSTQTA